MFLLLMNGEGVTMLIYKSDFILRSVDNKMRFQYSIPMEIRLEK